jgi:hypothetical protein
MSTLPVQFESIYGSQTMHALAATNQSSCLPLDLLASIPMQYAETLLFLLAHYAVPLQ